MQNSNRLSWRVAALEFGKYALAGGSGSMIGAGAAKLLEHFVTPGAYIGGAIAGMAGFYALYRRGHRLG